MKDIEEAFTALNKINTPLHPQQIIKQLNDWQTELNTFFDNPHKYNHERESELSENLLTIHTWFMQNGYTEP